MAKTKKELEQEKKDKQLFIDRMSDADPDGLITRYIPPDKPSRTKNNAKKEKEISNPQNE